MKRHKGWIMSCDVGKALSQTPTLSYFHLHHISSNHCVASPTSQPHSQLFCRFTYVTSHYLTLPSLHLRHSLILQPFRRFTYVTSHPTLPSLHLRHSSLSNPSVSSRTSQSNSRTLSSLHLHHISLSNPSVASPT